MVLPIGTIVNVIAVLIGGFIGLTFKKFFTAKIQEIVFIGLGLSTFVIGTQMAIKIDNPLLLIFAIIIGGIIGESLQLQEKSEKGAEYLKKRIKSKNSNFTEGLVSAFMLFCIGTMTFLGSINEGLGQGATILYTKSLLDGFAAMALSSTLGTGVLFSVIPLFIFQVALTLSAGLLGPILTPQMILRMTCLGGLLIIGIGLNLLNIKKIKLINLLPGIFIIAILSIWF